MKCNVIFLFILLSTSLLQAQVKTVESKKKSNEARCNSSKEFTSTLVYLRKQKRIVLPDAQNIQIALKVASHCNDSSQRFQKIFELLTQSGVDHNHALKFATEYCEQDNVAVEVFLNLFKGLVFEKKYNMSFYEAFETAKFFAENTKGDQISLKEDFIGFLGFCFSDKEGMQLSLQKCRSLSLNYLKLNTKFPKGVFADFKKLFNFLRQDRHTGLSIAVALDVTEKVLAYGNEAADNFIESYKYGLFQLNLVPKEALSLGLRLASFTDIKKEDKDLIIK